MRSDSWAGVPARSMGSVNHRVSVGSQPCPRPETYSYLGPSGTFTWAALTQVPDAAGKAWRSVNNVGEALDDVLTGRSVAAMIAIENSVEGGVTAAQDALASIPGLRIVGEYLVPVDFVLVARPGTKLADVHVVAAHPVAYAQCHLWLDAKLPDHEHLPATSNVTAAMQLLDEGSVADAAVAPPGIDDEHPRRGARHEDRRQPERGHAVRAGQHARASSRPAPAPTRRA